MKKSPRDNSLGAQMAIVLQLMKRKNHQVFKESGHKITIEQLAILEMLKVQGEMNMSELSVALWKQNANITRMVDKLEKKKYVLRKPLKGDRRAYLLCITDVGKQVYKEVIPLVISTYKEMISCLTEEEEAIVLQSLKKIIKHIS